MYKQFHNKIINLIYYQPKFIHNNKIKKVKILNFYNLINNINKFNHQSLLFLIISNINQIISIINSPITPKILIMIMTSTSTLIPISKLIIIFYLKNIIDYKYYSKIPKNKPSSFAPLNLPLSKNQVKFPFHHPMNHNKLIISRSKSTRKRKIRQDTVLLVFKKKKFSEKWTIWNFVKKNKLLKLSNQEAVNKN